MHCATISDAVRLQLSQRCALVLYLETCEIWTAQGVLELLYESHCQAWRAGALARLCWLHTGRIDSDDAACGRQLVTRLQSATVRPLNIPDR
jgi:hypothetical protein